MLQDVVDGAGEMDGAALHEAYLAALREAIEAAGREAVAEASGLAPETVAALADGEPVELTLEDAAGVLGAAEGVPGETVAAEARDHLLLGMTTAVLDVDTVAANLDGEMSATGVQQRIEGRSEMTLSEFARLHAFIAGRQP